MKKKYCNAYLNLFNNDNFFNFLTTFRVLKNME